MIVLEGKVFDKKIKLLLVYFGVSKECRGKEFENNRKFERSK